MGYEVRAIGWVRSTRVEVVDDDWDLERSSIVLDDAVPDGALAGLEQFSHADVIFLFDRATDAPPAPFARHPRGNEAWPLAGIFAQRAKDRPNRIGLTTCRILSVSTRSIELEGLDAVDGTPVLDIKPHIAALSARGDVHQPAWVDELMAGYFSNDDGRD
jgi:tRNA-Thr(GGU) m(6)t(6)A37 methyltransferase TsaA